VGRISSIDRLPAEARSALQGWLAEPGITQQEAKDRVNDLLADMGIHDLQLTRSAVNRYDIRMREVGQRLRERHEVAEMWIGKFGRMPAGQLGQLIIQMVHGLAFDAGVQLSELEMDAENMPGTVKMLKELAITIERTERAASLNAEREAEIRREEREAAAGAAETIARQGGMSKDTVEAIKASILGVPSGS